MTEAQTQREYWSGKVGDEWANHAHRIDAMLTALTDDALALAAFKTGEQVLDIGCGAGATSLAIAARVSPNGNVVGVDLSPQMLDIAQKRASQIGAAARFIEADAGSAAFDQRFDAAFSRFGVMFFDAPAEALANIRAAMAEDGRLIFVCWRALKQNTWATLPIDAIRPMLTAPLSPPDPDAPGPYAFADQAKVQRILSQAGWRDIAFEKWNGDLPLAGGGSVAEAADFILKIGPCARAITEHTLDRAEARQRIAEAFAQHHDGKSVALPAACWIVTARA